MEQKKGPQRPNKRCNGENKTGDTLLRPKINPHASFASEQGDRVRAGREGSIPPESLIAGKNALLAAFQSGREINKVYLSQRLDPKTAGQIKAMAKEHHVPLSSAPLSKLSAMAGDMVHQGILAVAAPVSYYELDELLQMAREKGEAPFLMILDGIQDPQNLGAILRIADAAGAHGIILPKRRGCPLTGAAMRASAGAGEFVPVCRQSSLAQTIDLLKKENIWVYAAHMTGSEPYYEASFGTSGTALVIGGEDSGVSKLVLEKCDVTVSVPMLGQVSSLNAAASAAILAYKVVEARQKEKAEGGRA